MKVLSPTTVLALGGALLVSSFDAVSATACSDDLTAVSVTSIAKDASAAIAPATADTSKCAGKGQHVYLKKLVILPETGTTKDDLTVTFTSGEAKTVVSATAASDCEIKYTDVGKVATVTDNVSAGIKCGLTGGCKVKYQATFGCYSTLVDTFTKVVKRTKQTGKGCTSDTNKCVDFCAKSYTAAVATASSTTTLSLTSALTNSDCPCTAQKITATVGTDGVSAANTASKIDVTYVDDVLTVKKDVDTEASACESTYSIGSYNTFPTGKTFTRGEFTESACKTSTECAFKCGNELTLTSATDQVTANQATVDGCTCSALKATVVDDLTATGAGTGTGFDDVTYTWTVKGAGFEIKTAKGKDSPVTCTAQYTEKASAGGSSTNSPSPSPTSGVSVNTIWAVAATAVVAVAGAFVMV